MSSEVITNNQYRPILYFTDLSEKQQQQVMNDFDWIWNNDGIPIDKESDLFWDKAMEYSFFVYKNDVYTTSNFMRINDYAPDLFSGWDGYQSFGYVGGLVLKYSSCGDMVKIGWY